MKISIPIFFALFCISTANAMTPEGCAKIESDTLRLSCYDDAFGRTTTNQEETQLATSNWKSSVDVSALTDEKTVVLTVESENSLPPRFGASGPATLILRCKENRTVAYFTFNGHHMADLQSYGLVEYRVDSKPMSTIRTAASTDNKALGLWSGGKSISFIRKLIDADKLVVRATPFNESPMTATFKITGLDKEITALRSTCNW